VKNKKDLKHIVQTLKLVLHNSSNQKAIKKADDAESTSVIEHIYEPIWDCTNRYESIYEPLNIIEDKKIHDEECWIIDAEFSYLPQYQILSARKNMYKTVQIVHRQLFENDAISLSNDMIQSRVSLTNSDCFEFDSVRAWKELLRSPFFNEDEEEFVRKIYWKDW
jgi:hypothetical protein